MGRSDVLNGVWARLHDEEGVSYCDLSTYDNLVVYCVADAWRLSSWRGDEKMIRLMVKGGVDVNQRDAKGLFPTALEAATMRGDVKTASFLLEHGADWYQGFQEAIHQKRYLLSMISTFNSVGPNVWEDALSGVNRVLRMCLRARLAPYKEELYAKALHPDRVAKWVALGVDDMMFGF